MISYWYTEGYDRQTYYNAELAKHHADENEDKVISENFMSWYDKVEKGELEHWKNDHYGRLALIIICDQFPRKMFRNSPKSCNMHYKANEVALTILNDPTLLNCYRNHELTSIARVFLNSEDPAVIPSL